MWAFFGLAGSRPAAAPSAAAAPPSAAAAAPPAAEAPAPSSQGAAPQVPRLDIAAAAGTPAASPDGSSPLKSARLKPKRAAGDGTVSALESARIKDYVKRRANEGTEEQLARLSRQWNEQLAADAAKDAATSGAADAWASSQPPIAGALTPMQHGSIEHILEYAFSIGGDEGDDALGSDAVGGDALAFSEPAGVATLPDGELCVADTKGHRLVILTPEGQPRAYLRGGPGKEALRLPRGVASDETHLYVSEVGGSRLRKLRLPDEFRRAGAETPRGAHLGGLALDAAESVEGQLTFPQGVRHSDGQLLVCDCEEHTVVVYDAATLKYVRSFGQPASSPDACLYYPYDCVVVGAEVIVADAGNHRLVSFSRRTGSYVRTIGEEGDAPGRFRTPRGVALLAHPSASAAVAPGGGGGGGGDAIDAMIATGGGGGGGGGASGIIVDGKRALLPRGALLVVCEQTRVQVLTLAGTPLQILDGWDAPRSLVRGVGRGAVADLWSIAALGRFTYITDKGSSCVHVFAPPRTANGADAAKARYAAMTPRAGAKAAQLAAMARMEREALEADKETPPSGTRGSGGGGGGGPRAEAAAVRRKMLMADVSPSAGGDPSGSGGGVGDGSKGRDGEERVAPADGGAGRASAARAAMEALKESGVSGAAAVLRAQQQQATTPTKASLGARVVLRSPPSSGGSSSSSALSEAVRRVRATPSPPSGGANKVAAVVLSPRSPRSPRDHGVRRDASAAMAVVPGGLSVLGRGEKLEEISPNKRVLARVASPRRGGKGEVTVSLGRKNVV